MIDNIFYAVIHYLVPSVAIFFMVYYCYKEFEVGSKEEDAGE